MFLSTNHLRSHVLRSSTSVLGVLCDKLASYAKISNIYIAIIANDKIFGFDVSMNVTIRMNAIQTKSHATHNEL